MPESNRVKELAHRWLATALKVESPFPWQLALLDRFLEGRAPAAIDVPTGLGKTAVMATWLVARAAGASLPRRLVYVVDRRAVVDQATAVAEHLREVVEGDSELKRSLGLEDALPISTLRGKYLDNRRWLADPSVPAIVLGTVDMIGSRLLFEGYGVSRKMRPYHAGLLGTDSLLVLDEAHLVPPFERLVESLASGRDGNGALLAPKAESAAVVPAFRFLSLSATGRARADALVLSGADREHPTVARRLSATKRTTFLAEVSARELPEFLAETAWSLSEGGTKPMRCIVFCTSRDDAKKVKDALDARRSKAGIDAVETELFVGGRRLYEREQAARWLEQRGFIAGSGMRPVHPTFVIATAAGEVGVDLDADEMVCDLVAWERMVQRLGRVNRRGEGRSRVMIVPATHDDPDESARRAAARAVLEALPRYEDGSIDASPGALSALKARSRDDSSLSELVERASTTAPLHPPLTRPTVEAWSMTSIEKHSGRPEVAPWIRGWIDGEEEQTTVVWRQYLPVDDAGRLLSTRDLEAYREAAEPHLAERLETETWRIVEWLGNRLATLEGLAEGEAERAVTERPLRKGDTVGVILDRVEGARALSAHDLSNKQKRDGLARALSGAVLLVDERLGGLTAGLLDAESSVAPDVTRFDSKPRAIPFRIRRVTDVDDSAGDGPEWRREARIAVRAKDDEETAWLVIESVREEAAESEEGRSVGASRAQELEEHESWAEEAASRIARQLGLPKGYAETLEAAARLHDEGKRAKCWQRAFKAPSDGVYAKTTSRPNLHLLNNYRHELGSLPYAERHERVLALPRPLRELCLHLIAAHHGNARPLVRTDGAEEPPSRLTERAREVALRFVRLEKEWGPWGLAWWESLLRAADQQASRRNDEQGEARG